ncbi:MAG: excinuclease ABC subunit C [Gammaproteobacteria bacterium]|nr:MAG: excinuclease ABC subunit [Methylocystaceae bacterium]TND00575.1 MAG: excinuclease ABC subunit C [Gammaproteobacteria bacterium]
MSQVGHYKWGVFAFLDYDGEPIYVGQTNEVLRTRTGRHLTNQRTNAVAMFSTLSKCWRSRQRYHNFNRPIAMTSALINICMR